MRKPALIAAVLLASGLALVPTGSASAASSATLGDVSCVDEQGAVTLTLTADDGRDTLFVYSISGDIYSGGPSDEKDIVVPAGGTEEIVFSDLEDGNHEVLVWAESADLDLVEILDETITVACDPTPDGPYTNAKGVIWQSCGTEVGVHAANRPIGGNVEDLQPVTFTLTMLRNGQSSELVTFALPDETEDPYTNTATVDLRDFGIDPDEPVDGGGEDGEGPGGRTTDDEIALVLTANDTELRRETFYLCVVAPSSGEGEGGGPAVVNTGA